ncbi:MAG: ATP-dependent RNA helicase dbp7 [Candelina submexicana]|nr:MAG: ATP-dependent RNA helicase dbp7 [Candelina submexicana]
MAEDGLLMNFSLEENVLKAVPAFKGGRWKDRLAAKRIAQYRQQKALTPSKLAGANSTASNLEQLSGNDAFPTSQPAKRRRLSEKINIPSVESDPVSRRLNPPGKGLQQVKGKPQQVISSLFSYNPKSMVTVDELEENSTKLQPSNAPLVDGLENFTDLGLSPVLAAHLLNKLDLKAPTAIQKAAIRQLINEDSDAFIQAETGSGKTLAYLLPIVERIMRLSEKADHQQRPHGEEMIHRDSGLFAIILGPTRELCKQIAVVLDNLLRCAHWIVAGTVIGGEKKKSEKARLRKGLNILVATPGRLADHLENTEVLDVHNVRWLVLDEGDRLMDHGFEAEIQGIVSRLDQKSPPITSRKGLGQGLPSRRTTVLCSATMKMNVQRLGEISLRDAVHIMVDQQEQITSAKRDADIADPSIRTFSAPTQLKQSYAVVPAKLRLVTLTAVLKRASARRGSVTKVIVFISCADSVDFHFAAFTRAPEKSAKSDLVDETDQKNAPRHIEQHGTIAPASAFSNTENRVILHKLHGSLPQNVRTSTLNSFSKIKDPAVLVCTDVASRGLDLPDVDIVIEFDPPFSRDDHLHRIGRTARAGKDGRSLVFLLPGDEEGYINIMNNTYLDGVSGLKRTDADTLLQKGFSSAGRSTRMDWEGQATEWQLEIERWALETPKYLEMARRAYQSHVRAYCTHIATERHIFNIKTLHLGHLAKSFALRDKPASIKVPGLRQQKHGVKVKDSTEDSSTKDRQNKAKKAGHERQTIDGQEAVRKMRMKMREQQLAGALEFNLG